MSNDIISTREAEERIAAEYHRTGNYTEMYRQHAKLADMVWNDTTRPDYEADIWYNNNRNKICLEMLGNICEGKRVISVGGGQWMEGVFLKQLKASEIIRTDIVGDTNNGILEAPAEALPFSDESFDVVICREVIEHVKDTDAVFVEMKRVLKRGGYLLITTPNAYTLAMDGTFHVRMYTPTTFINELVSYGFKVVKKHGNLPYILQGLMTYAGKGFEIALEDFKIMDALTKNDENRYYMSTQLFVLVVKE
jgi:SAM-dependent methyltransferase